MRHGRTESLYVALTGGLNRHFTDLSDLREHALFAVRNLMYENEENQEVLRGMEPLGVVGDDGELLPLPESMKNKGGGTK